MLSRELKLYQNYINKEPTDTEMLKNLTKLQHDTRGELFDMIIGNRKQIGKEHTVIVIILIINLMANLLGMALLLS